MPIVSMRQLLDHAAENGYGLPAFNVNNLEQVQAIMEAACELARDENVACIPEIEIPLVGHCHELMQLRAVCDKVCQEVIAKTGVKVDYTIGTMIELPRAAITADEIAKCADFFSFSPGRGSGMIAGVVISGKSCSNRVAETSAASWWAAFAKSGKASAI